MPLWYSLIRAGWKHKKETKRGGGRKSKKQCLCGVFFFFVFLLFRFSSWFFFTFSGLFLFFLFRYSDELARCWGRKVKAHALYKYIFRPICSHIRMMDCDLFSSVSLCKRALIAKTRAQFVCTLQGKNIHSSHYPSPILTRLRGPRGGAWTHAPACGVGLNTGSAGMQLAGPAG